MHFVSLLLTAASLCCILGRIEVSLMIFLVFDFFELCKSQKKEAGRHGSINFQVDGSQFESFRCSILLQL